MSTFVLYPFIISCYVYVPPFRFNTRLFLVLNTAKMLRNINQHGIKENMVRLKQRNIPVSDQKNKCQ